MSPIFSILIQIDQSPTGALLCFLERLQEYLNLADHKAISTEEELPFIEKLCRADKHIARGKGGNGSQSASDDWLTGLPSFASIACAPSIGFFRGLISAAPSLPISSIAELIITTNHFVSLRLRGLRKWH
eukprot:Blabericola_migrator_1__321@NODE_1082_length_5496_cov_1003_158224_g741_i0_p4_GENE_NODE_1082_length_5496_cov_1003_158224_g741_i0NODE_1082_length_5496_cov_1003_158224_g741_i0_p4_ORF_typecomplete_len130_score15_53_NODE_1082_length_5496_cov_1003_158224_g741_i045664955